MKKFSIIKNDELSGPACAIYSIKVDDAEDTLFEQFEDLWYDENPDAINDIYTRLQVIGHETGLRDIFCKRDEGKPGDGIWALYDNPNSNVRLYFIQFGKELIILGGGGPKPKQCRSWQDSPILSEIVPRLHDISILINKARKEGDITILDNEIKGNLTIKVEDYQ